MPTKSYQRKLSQVYLTLVPILTVVFGLGVGYISYKIYLPVWLVNVILMIAAMWALGAHVIKTGDAAKKQIVACAVLFILPTLLTSMFFGLGAPPYNQPSVWMASASEQTTRYYFLLAAGVFIAAGFAVLRDKLKHTAGGFYSLLGSVAVQLAVPIFLINMTFWGFYLTGLYKIMAASAITKTPQWVLPLHNQFFFINMLVTALFYLATSAFATALKKAGWLKPIACNIYLAISLLFLLLDVLPPQWPEPFATLNFIVSIPAIPFMLPYFIGVNLLRRIGDDSVGRDL